MSIAGATCIDCGNGRKQVPVDVRLTSRSILLWYLADGGIVLGESTVMLRLATDGFDPPDVEFLAGKLRDLGIACHRNNGNRIQVEARGLPAFFNMIGRTSPVACYDHKFAIPHWRFEAKRMSEVATALRVDYHRLAHLVKTGRQPCLRVTEGTGRPRFLPEHVAHAEQLKRSGELY